MSHIVVAQGGSNKQTVTFFDREGGHPVDDDRYATQGTLPVLSVHTPPGGANAPTLSLLTRLSKGTYEVTISAPLNATLTSTLGGNDWKTRWSLRINGEDETFEFPFDVVQSGAASEGPTFYNPLSDYRRGIAEANIVLTHGAIAAGGILDQLGIQAVRVLELTKNGAALAEGQDFTFRRPYTLAFTDAVAETDVLFLRAGIHIEDKEIELIAGEVKTSIDTALSGIYTLPFATVPPKIRELERAWVRGRLMLEFGPRPGIGLSENDRKLAFNLVQNAKKDLDDVRKLRLPLVLPDGTQLASLVPTADLFLDIQTDATR